MPPAKRASSKVTSKQEVFFDREKETPGTVRYKEAVEDGQPPLIGLLYLKKAFASKLGEPDALKITVEADDS